ncbi:MAG TPA: hypothetical protein VFS25_14295 [Chitinophaga sp.]|uniref:hypothetical protein n=1 Tax=Chitinophaga sp. TaxID=1869181 RepID=UPI002DB65B48|nr:hypothetical protein [Chitinophaga sp.]HEU4554009.1 hypothetical protein [Chitinophaga sp.]
MKVPPSPKHPTGPLQLTGKLELRTFYANTKRSFTGTYLVSDIGTFLIRPARQPVNGANPLQPLLGKTITAAGQIKHGVFLAEELAEVNG